MDLDKIKANSETISEIAQEIGELCTAFFEDASPEVLSKMAQNLAKDTKTPLVGTRRRGVYGYFLADKLVYVGSSGCSIETLADNHRNWNVKYGPSGRTKFRSMLVEDPAFSAGQFRWIISPVIRTAEEVETLEGELIRCFLPLCNKDLNPVLSSKQHGRY